MRVVAVVDVRLMNHEADQILEAQVDGVVITVVQHHSQLLVVVAEVLRIVEKLLAHLPLVAVVVVVVITVVVQQEVAVLCLFDIHHRIKKRHQLQEQHWLHQVGSTIIYLLALEAFNSKKKFDRSVNM
jgi:hypothetical protein